MPGRHLGFLSCQRVTKGRRIEVKVSKSSMPAALCGYPAEEQGCQKHQSQQRVYCVPGCTVCDEGYQQDNDDHDDDPAAAEAFATTAAAATARATAGAFERMIIIHVGHCVFFLP